MILALLAGVLSTLSPCVLPLVPIVLGTALSRHRLGPVALAAGLTVSFTLLGLFVATVGFTLGLTTEVFRVAAAVLLVLLGIVLVSPALQTVTAVPGPALGNWADQRIACFSHAGLSGQFYVGLLLGAVWTPCVGPTLGAASLLAAQGESLGQVALTMFAFGIGTAVPLLLLGFLSRDLLLRWRGRLAAVGRGGKTALGAFLIGTGLIVISGLDKFIEARLVRILPEWLTRLATMY